MKKNTIELSIVALILLCAACVAHCEETNKPPVVTNPPPLVVSDTAELKTDGPLSHFQLYSVVETQRVLIKREDTIVSLVVSNTLTRAFSWTKEKGWTTNDALPSAITPILLSTETNVVNVPLR